MNRNIILANDSSQSIRKTQVIACFLQQQTEGRKQRGGRGEVVPNIYFSSYQTEYWRRQLETDTVFKMSYDFWASLSVSKSGVQEQKTRPGDIGQLSGYLILQSEKNVDSYIVVSNIGIHFRIKSIFLLLCLFA